MGMANGLKSSASTLARRIAFAAETRDRAELEQIRRDCVDLILDVDPDSVDEKSPSYRYGSFDVLASIVSALEEQTLSANTCELLSKSGRARILNAVVGYPGRNQKQLSSALGIQESNLAIYLRELLDERLLEPSPRNLARGRCYTLTPWGKKAWEKIVASHKSYGIPWLELRQGLDAKTPSPREHGLIKKEDFYKEIFAALTKKSEQPVHLSTLFTSQLDTNTQSAQFHRRAIQESGHLQRPIHWIFAKTPKSEKVVKQLQSHCHGDPRMHLYFVEPSEVPVPTQQVLDTEGLVYPVVKDFAQSVDRDSALITWNKFLESATPVGN